MIGFKAADGYLVWHVYSPVSKQMILEILRVFESITASLMCMKKSDRLKEKNNNSVLVKGFGQHMLPEKLQCALAIILKVSELYWMEIFSFGVVVESFPTPLTKTSLVCSTGLRSGVCKGHSI